jgi:hypothetical protein
MHRYLISLLLVSWVLLGFGQATSLEEAKQRVYVWEFSTQDTGKATKKLAHQLTNDFETELIQSGFYEVLEIREFSRLEEHRDLQRLIFNLHELSEEERHQLYDQKAEAVFFGKLIHDESSKQVILEIKLQHMDGRILRKGSIYLEPSELIMIKSRRAKILELFTEVHEEIFEAQRQALEEKRTTQFELITEKLNQYIRRTEDLTTQFHRLDVDLLKVEGYVQEYAQCLSRYDTVITDLLEKHTLYENNFKVVWATDLGDQLTRVFEQILDFHYRYIFKSLQKRNDLMIRFGKTKNKSESQKLKDDLIKEKREFENTMNDQWPVVKSDIEQFLYHFRSQLK